MFFRSIFRLTTLSIRSLLLLITFIVALPAAGIIVYSGIQFRNQLLNDARIETLRLADSIATEQQNLVVGAEQLMTALALLPEVKGRDAARVEPILRELRKLNPIYSNIFIADREGIVWATAVPVKPPFVVADRRYFRNALASGQLSSGEYVVSRATTRPAFNLAYPLKDDHGAIIGVISVGFVIDQYRQLLERMQFRSGTSFVLSDHQGVVLYRAINPGMYIGKPYPADEFRKMKEGPEAGTTIRIGIAGDKRIISYRKVRLAGEQTAYMFVTVGMPFEVVTREANQALMFNIALLSSFLALACIGAVSIGKRSIVDRFRVLESASQRLAAGDLHVRVSDLVVGGELGRLGQTFDAMAEELAKRETDRLKAEIERDRLVSILETTTDVVSMSSAEGKIIYLNRAGRELTGIGEQLGSDVPISQMYPEWAAELVVNEGITTAIREGLWEGETALLDGNGREVPVSQVILSHRDVQGDLSHISTIMRDISERKEAERALEHNRNLLNETQKLAHMGSWELNLVTNVLIWSDEIYRIFEMTPEKFEGTYEAFLQAVHPEDRELVNKAYRKSVQEATPFETVHRIALPDGRVKILEERGETAYQEGTPVRTIGLVQDITELKAVQEEQQKVVSLVEMSYDFIGIASMEGNVLYLNQAALSLVGLSSIAEARTKSIFDFFPESNLDQARNSMHPAIVDNGTWHAESCFRHFQNGNIIDVEITAFTIMNPYGQPLCLATVTRDITERKRYEEKLLHQANHDPLTGLPNRNLLNDRFSQAMAGQDRYHSYLAMLLMDLDNFKYVNDTLGHSIGDLLLVDVANRIQRVVRKSDTVARLGGDEFVVVPGNVANSQDVARVAEQILAALSEPFSIEEREVFLTASIGIVVYPHDGDSLDHLLQHADVAMYHAKHLGKNNFQFFTADINKKIQERQVMETRLRRALEKNEFLLYYQPLIELRTDRVVGMEALLRWQPKGEEVVLPDKFIPLLEETGLIMPVGEWVLKNACKQLNEWRQAGHDIRLSVNISARQFHSNDIVERISNIVQVSGCPPRHICLELTESVIMEDSEGTINKLMHLREKGFSLAIDDFGTGFSSLNYLKRLPISEIKIDRTFVNGLPLNVSDTAIVSTIIHLANYLGMKVVAEGVETEEQLLFLSSNACGVGQGYYFSKPLPPNEVTF